MDNYLILGTNGLIGRSIKKNISENHKWFGTYHKRYNPELIKINILSDDDLKKIFKISNPDYVINCTNLAGGVNFCEKNQLLAKKFHLDANVNIGKLCEKYSSKFIMISTDYVFDGKNESYKENDNTNPLNLYGKLKLESEKYIINNISKYAIIRTTNVFGWDPKTITPNYIMNLYRTVKENNKTFNAPSFLYGNPTYVNDLALGIIELCKKDINDVFHIVGNSFINRYEWVLKTCKKGKWDASLIKEIKDVPKNMIPRPLKSNLSTKKFQNCCKTKLHNVNKGIDFFIEKMKISEELIFESKHYGFNL